MACKLSAGGKISKLDRAKQRSLSITPQKEIEHKPKRNKVVEENQLGQEDMCFFCGEDESSRKTLHRASTFHCDSKVRDVARISNDTILFGKLSEGDMMALDASDHVACLATLYKARNSLQMNDNQSSDRKMYIWNRVC